MWAFAKIYGSYIGEVMRRAHGGTWGVATLGDEEAVALDLPVTPSRPSGWKVCVGIVPVVGRQPTEASGKNAPRSKARRTKAFEDMTPESATHVPPRTAQLHATSR